MFTHLGDYFFPCGLQIEATNAKFPSGLAAGTLFHPLFLYEIIWNLVGVGIILLVERKLYLRWGRRSLRSPSVIRDGWVPRTQRRASPLEPIASSTTEESVRPTPQR